MRKNDPATIVTMNGRPKSAKGCFARSLLYREAIVFASADPRYFLFEKEAILDVVGIILFVEPVVSRWGEKMTSKDSS